MHLEKPDIDYFNKRSREISKFWSRLGGMPDFEDKTILEIGCGYGALCLEVASKGAKKIIGIDTDEHRINFANEILSQNFPELIGIIDFKCCDISTLHEYQFDIILSQDTFEHVINPNQCMNEIYLRLNNNGRVYIGFSPLYNDPYGDHKRTESIIPWGHLIFSEGMLLKRLNNKYPEKEIRSLTDLGLNMMSFKQWEELFNNCKLHLLYFKTNQGSNIFIKLFSILRCIPGLQEYFTRNIYCILQKMTQR